MSAIYIKELKSYFKSLSGWLFMAAFTFFAGLYFSYYNLRYGSPYVSDTLISLLIIVIFLVPLLTMRSFAEEKKLKTDQLLLTLPIRISSIVLGKFFAMATIMAMATVIISFSSVILACYGDIPAGETILSLVAFFMFGCICIAVGMFLSSVTEHQIIAAILTYGVFIFMFLVPSFCQNSFGTDSWISKIVSLVDIISPYDMLFFGIIVFKDVVYIFSVIIICIVLTCFMVGRNNFRVKAGEKKRLITGVAGVVLFFAVMIGLNIGANYLPLNISQIDVTQDKWYTITDETKDMLKGLEEEVTIYVIGSEETVDETVELYLELYQDSSKNVNVEYKPLELYPNFATEYTGTAMEESGLIVEMGDSYRVIPYADCYVVEYFYDEYYQPTATVTGIDVEGQLTGAIASLLSGVDYKVYFLEGHNEMTISESMLSRFRKGGYTVSNLSLLHETAVPDDAVAVVINGPESDLSKTETEAIEQYIERGGNVIMMASLDIVDTPNYDALMENYGISLTAGSVLESDYYYVYSEIPFALLPDAVYHDVSAPVYNNQRYALLIQSRGMFVKDDVADNMEVYPLFESTDSAYAKVLTAESLVEYEEGDDIGPFYLGVCTEVQSDNGKTSIVTMIGTPAFLYEDIDTIVSGANSDVFFAALNYGSEVEIPTTIPAKSVNSEYILVSTGMQSIYVSIIVLLIPLCFLIAGIVILITRRKK